MRKKIVLSVLAILSFGIGVVALAKPGPPPPPPQNCKFAVCAQCPEGYHLGPQIWPDCCVCVPD